MVALEYGAFKMWSTYYDGQRKAEVDRRVTTVVVPGLDALQGNVSERVAGIFKENIDKKRARH